MSIRPTGSFSRSAGLFSAIGKNIRLMNLKGVKRITTSFDPFHQNVKATRYGYMTNVFTGQFRLAYISINKKKKNELRITAHVS